MAILLNEELRKWYDLVHNAFNNVMFIMIYYFGGTELCNSFQFPWSIANINIMLLNIYTMLAILRKCKSIYSAKKVVFLYLRKIHRSAVLKNHKLSSN